MKTNSLLGAALSMPQWIFWGILAFGVVFFLFVFFYFMYLLINKPELKAEIARKAKEFRDEAKRMKTENQRSIAEIKRSSKEIDEKNKRTMTLEAEIERMRDELMRQGVEEEHAREISNMTVAQLQLLKGKEMTDVSGAFIINAITRRVLIDSEFERRTDIEDFKVPINKTTGVKLEAVNKEIMTFLEVEKKEGKGKRADTYRTADKSFALLSDRGDGTFLLKIKCGSYYGLRLCGLYPEFIEKATYPYGMTWFDVKNADGCSMELIRLLINISYNVARAGF